MASDNTHRTPERLSGRYFAAGGSASRNAWLEDRGNALGVIDGETGVETRVVFERLGDRLADLPRKIYFADGSLFECADNDAVDLAFGKDKHFFTRMAVAESSTRFIVLAVVAVVLLLFAGYRWGLPAAAYVAANSTPNAVLAFMDNNALDTVDRVLLNPSQLGEEDKQKYTKLFSELVVAAREEGSPLNLKFRDGGRLGANALALPGGTVILTDQLVALAKSEDEIAGVMAHEIGHYTGKHSLRQIYRALGIGVVISVVVGDTGAILDDVIAQAALLDTLKHSREFELEADRTSVEIMTNANRDPRAFIVLLDRLVEELGVSKDRETGWIDTHPANKDRRALVDALTRNR